MNLKREREKKDMDTPTGMTKPHNQDLCSMCQKLGRKCTGLVEEDVSDDEKNKLDEPNHRVIRKDGVEFKVRGGFVASGRGRGLRGRGRGFCGRARNPTEVGFGGGSSSCGFGGEYDSGFGRHPDEGGFGGGSGFGGGGTDNQRDSGFGTGNLGFGGGRNNNDNGFGGGKSGGFGRDESRKDNGFGGGGFGGGSSGAGFQGGNSGGGRGRGFSVGRDGFGRRSYRGRGSNRRSFTTSDLESRRYAGDNDFGDVKNDGNDAGRKNYAFLKAVYNDSTDSDDSVENLDVRLSGLSVANRKPTNFSSSVRSVGSNFGGGFGRDINGNFVGDRNGNCNIYTNNSSSNSSDYEADNDPERHHW